MDTAEIIMYPIKQRIFRYFLIHETGSVDEIKKSIARVLSASLYRHIKISANSSVLLGRRRKSDRGRLHEEESGKGRQNAAMREIRAQKTGSDYSRLPSVTGLEPVAPTKQNFA